ncbi:uncharacterized protein E0L32_007852 [Thyridium curvatum]|uniref:Phosphatidylinositol-specific phospholipase C X domain-containing protein n=1 Tax=Thyridium curvatum TaxID=1093900 RepID=A0A507AUM4_9PEZI|nr:uncharacterized protein E0L32_007852 [Thyridium curvatum]TPX11433.1 hypothetical protein E0L32_007852 [Thyridium curvatum]
MASLTIRNLTITPLELKHVERFEGEAQPMPSGGAGEVIANVTANVTGAITSLFNKTAEQTPAAPAAPEPVKFWGVKRREGAGPHDQQDVSVSLAPFETKTTDIRAADPNREVMHLVFEQPGGPGRYAVDCPAPSPQSVVMERLDGADKEFTAVYIASAATLAIFSSAQLPRWMGALADGYPLTALSIPGTHNSPTCHTALPSVRCQAVGVREQLDNGVRFMDIRVSASPDSDDLTLVHSAFPISLTGNKYLADLLRDCYEFLDANPSEVLLMSLKREGTGKGSDADLSRYLRDRYLGGDDARRWYTDPSIPRLGDVRGRIVLVRRFGLDDSMRGEHDGRGWGVDGSSWPDNCADGTCGSNQIRVQDFYEVDQATNIEKKIELARAHLERCGEQTFNIAGGDEHPSPFFVNFLSASNFFNANCWPDRIAQKVNPAVIEYLCVRHGDHGKGPGQLSVGDACTGVVVTDWVGYRGDWDLIRCIVGWNARLQLKQ